ncbi:hypothetical protein [Hyunsoonleella pacifica]|uniref:Cellobiose phosphorylase n=1 Tax=Hyunsoonleella pacifica TaxID=1080224 RepID=A0A4Q9FQD8_9FLAO|nr:hypothetical protein [Hyunsoonleella pacifica]TBN16682.1 hypothetical protein EYD46_08605 [Hyunsoonleella pacifica]GGD17377.1 hypothetical protein GCM10011368_19130 [Hyunsoonleella pacifica]
MIVTEPNKVSDETRDIKGELITFNNETYYKISNSDEMRPFFMSIVSDSNHWMFISSNGGLTAGRKNAEYSLFPYYTDDKITEMAETTGSKAIFQITKNGNRHLWEPFSIRQTGIYKTQTNLYKNRFGNKIVFEENNLDLGLTFRYEWNSSNKFGFVKKSTLINNSDVNIQVALLDGLQNILPASVTADLQNSRSNLVDAYKKSELQEAVGLGVYALSSVIVDKAEPSEALKSNIVWSTGLENPTYLLSSLQLDNFRKGKTLSQEMDVKAEKGAYFACTEIELLAGQSKNWMFIANVNQSISDVIKISEIIKNESDLKELVQKNIDLGTKNLIGLTASSDGLQQTDDPLISMRHFSNTLFNIMRGGIFDDGYTIEKSDFSKYIANANKDVFKEKESLLTSLSDIFSLDEILNIAEHDSNKDFQRLCFEYLPLKFSRRHGDPSRPWNKFSINTRNEIDGSKVLDYEGNWRDIFQNWEALAHSYPNYIEGMIHKFLNATTFEGYNPYRVTKGGFDWEVIEEHDPWSYIGYWGDHQIIYLLKFLEFIEDYFPGRLEKRFNQDVFVYANVPYIIKSYQDTLKNSKDTIDFDHKLDQTIHKRRDVLGADGALLLDKDSNIYRVNFIEKILATVLSKISNFIPEGGIWLNTQRPEWNDANNALVGNGVSMVTLYYIYRFLNFFEGIVLKAETKSVKVSEELILFFNKVTETLQNNANILSGTISDRDRKTVLDGLGKAGSNYRATIYKNGFTSAKTELSFAEISSFIEVTKSYLEHSIDANKREDNMYHAYNLMTVENNEGVSISYLSEMLEGQVAALSSGYLSPIQALNLLDGLKASALFREDQYSYILYPDKTLPRFDKKNNIPAHKVAQSTLLKQLVADGNKQVIEQDARGDYHFNGNFNNANSLVSALKSLDEKYQPLVENDKEALLQIFEDIFDHKSFTGRSGTFFGYEGLGSIYWHMVSKLLLAVQENCWMAINNGEDQKIIGRLLDHYYEINAGIGVHKSPELYGAFPTDPYSHTPATKGAQQPGMTGQVKEDILSRFGELGVFVEDGKITFKPHLLQVKEFLKLPSVFSFSNTKSKQQDIEMKEDTLGFTYCQVPVIYKLSSKEQIQIQFNNSRVVVFDKLQLDWETSKSIFERKGEVNQIIVSIKK